MGTSPGRPSDYNPDFHPVEVVRLMRGQGYLVCEVANEWDIAESTFYLWVVKHPIFSEAYKRAKTAKKAWWVNQARKGLHTQKGETFNVIVWSMVMRNLGVNTEERAIELMELASSDNYVEQCGIVKQHLACGKITPKEAKSVLDVIAQTAKVEENTELKQKLQEIEEAMNVRSGQ